MTDSEDKRTQTHTIRNTRPKDSGAKLIFDNPVLCAQFIRDYLNVDILKDVQPEDIEDISERFLSMWQENRDSDCVKKIHLSGTAGPDALFLIAMIEHQSSVDYDMPFRILRYITHILTDYAAEAEKRQPRITARKDFRYPPVLPVIFYDGPGSWTAAADFRDKVYLNEILGEYIPSFKYIVVPLSCYSAEDLIGKNNELSLLLLIDKLRSSSDFKFLRNIPDEYFENLGRNSPESVLKLMRTVISVLLLKLNVPKEEVAEFTDRIERRDFSVLFEHFEAYDVQETRRVSKAEGKIEGKAEAILDLLRDLGPVPEDIEKQIAQTTDLELLKKWLKAAARAEGIESFISQM